MEGDPHLCMPGTQFLDLAMQGQHVEFRCMPTLNPAKAFMFNELLPSTERPLIEVRLQYVIRKLEAQERGTAVCCVEGGDDYLSASLADLGTVQL